MPKKQLASFAKVFLSKLKLLWFSIKLHTIRDNGSFSDIAKEATALLFISTIVYSILKIFVITNSFFIIVEPFEVPIKLANNGYTGKTVSHRVVCAIENILNNSTFEINGTVINTGSGLTPDFTIPGSSVSLRTLAINIRETIGNPVPTVTGDIVENGNKLNMVVRLSGEKKLKKTGHIKSRCNNNDVDEIIEQAAEVICLQMNPLILAGYYQHSDNIEASLNILKTMNIDAKDSGMAYLMWAHNLFVLKDYDAALNQIEKASRASNNYTNYNIIYRTWCYILRKQGKYEEAILKADKALNYKQNDSYSLSVKGNIFKLQQKNKEAKFYLEEALKYNPNNVEAKNDLKELLSVR